MNHIVAPDSPQEAALQAAAERFIRLHRGDPMEALKAQIALNAHLQEQAGCLSAERR